MLLGARFSIHVKSSNAFSAIIVHKFGPVLQVDHDEE